MQSPLNARLTNILKHSVEVLLKPLGFRKQRMIYRRQLPELSWLIDVQRSRWNTSDKCEFTMNCGIYVPGVIPIYSPLRSEPKSPTVSDSVVYTRIGALKDGCDHWWTLRLDDESTEGVDTAIQEELRTLLERYALPFFNCFERRGDVANYLRELGPEDYKTLTWPPSETIALAYLGILYWLLGDQERCCETLDQAKMKAMQSPIKGFREHMEQLYHRLCSS